MKQIHVILEKGNDGYGVSFNEIPNVFGFGETVEKAKADARTALDFYVQYLNKTRHPVPEILQDEYELKFEFDIEALLHYIDGTVTKTALAKASGIHASLLSHYSSGLKKPRKEQREKIVMGIHALGRELLSVS
ncbi:MAG: type II toxin-antitoxin system HicB family antitoxin [Prevotellaceae bacterium]|jgi:predicted RNase H-like HicB family nuclease|nr:type II toxin-antitoxin system HicB family antitoxin [Prevotellaceae bacterium]